MEEVSTTQLEYLLIDDWRACPNTEIIDRALLSLESGQVLCFPHLGFTVDEAEKALFNSDICHRSRKNISYDLIRNRLGKIRGPSHTQDLLRAMMQRYAKESHAFMQRLFPYYADYLEIGRTSFRPVEIKDRPTRSIRKDDRRLHVDSFPATPMRERRIIRLFTNVNPTLGARIWRVGEHFKKVVERFMPDIKPPRRGLASLLRALRITRGKRSEYDHYMLHLHDGMKKDNSYQQTVNQQTIHFPTGSSWIVYTDAVSHAAMGGQYVLEQTFYLPVHKMRRRELAPLSILEQFCQRPLL
jgi:hypothetical protein